MLTFIIAFLALSLLGWPWAAQSTDVSHSGRGCKPEVKVPAGLFLVRVFLPLPPHMVESEPASSSPDKDTNPAVDVPPLDI